MSWMSKHAQRLWTREKPDGRHGWGALKWLLFGGLFVGGAIWFIHSMQGGGASSHAQAVIGNAPVAVNPAAKDVRIAEIAQAAQDTRPIVLPGAKGDSLAKAPSASVGSPTNDDKTPETSNDSMASFFGKPAAASSGQNAPKGTLNNTQPDTGNDSIFTALSRSSADADSADGRPVTDEDTASVKGKGQKGGRGGNGHSGPTEPGSPEADAADGKTERTMPSIEALMVKNIRPYPGQSSGSTGGYGAGSSTGHVMTHWLPRGEMVPVFLMQTVQTGNFPTLIEFAVAKTVWFLGKPILPFGTRFLATAGTGVRDRIQFEVDTLTRRDGLQIAARGIVLGPDKFTGVPAYFVPPPTMAQVAPYIASFTGAFADIIKARATQFQVGNVGVSVTQPPLSEQIQEAAVYATSQATTDFLASQIAQIKDRYQSYLTLPAGSFAYIQLSGDTDFSALWEPSTGKPRIVGTLQIGSTEAVYAKPSTAKSGPAANMTEMLNAIMQASQAAHSATGTPQVPGIPPVSPASAKQ